MSNRPVTLAVIIGAHGVAGEVRLKIFAEGPESLSRFKRFNGGTLTLKAVRPGTNGAIARFAEFQDRTAAERARGTELTVPREALPPLLPGEYYHADLIGLSCVSSEGTDIGTCIAVENFGAGDILEIERPDGSRFMVPMSTQAVPEWGERIVIDARFAG